MSDAVSGSVSEGVASGPGLADAVLGGDRRALAKAITLVESTRDDHRAEAETLLDKLLPHAGRSLRLGVTGTPGVGKSTFINRLGTGLVDDGRRLAVLAVDPSSRTTGGSILGDKTRMIDLAGRENVFIRPSPTAGVSGGVAIRTRDAITVCEAAGFDTIIVETVGVGQSETAVAGLTDMFLLLVAPGGGDDLQGIKRGVMELADLVAINKADGDMAAPGQPDRGRLPGRPAPGTAEATRFRDGCGHVLIGDRRRTRRPLAAPRRPPPTTAGRRRARPATEQAGRRAAGYRTAGAVVRASRSEPGLPAASRRRPGRSGRRPTIGFGRGPVPGGRGVRRRSQRRDGEQRRVLQVIGTDRQAGRRL